MLLRSSRALGVEIAGKRLIVVEVDPTTDPPAVLGAGIGEATPAGVGESLKSLLGEQRITSRVAHVVLSPASSVHRILRLPPMTPGERRLFLERELGREIGGNLLLDHRVLRVVDGPPRKDEVLVAAIPGDETNESLTGVMAASLSPRLVTTVPLALSRAAEVLSPESFDRPTAVAHWGFQGLTIVIADGGAPKFTREVPHLTVPGLDPREWFVTEFQRSIRQYMQAFKGSTVGTVLVGSVEPRFEAVLADIETRLGLPIVNLNEALRALLPEGTDDGSVPAGAFLTALGAGLLSPKDAVNLLPPSIADRRRLALLKRGAGVAAALLVVSLGYSTWGTAQEAATYRKAMAKLTAERQAREAGTAQIQQIKQVRANQYQRIGLLKSDPLGDPPLADVFKELSRVAPAGLRLERLVFGRDGTGVTIRLTGRFESADLAQAQGEFNQFYVGLQGSPLFLDVIFNPPPPPKVRIQQGPSGVIEGRTARDIQAQNEAGRDREGLSGQGRKVAFELELRLRGIK